jgi:hypothetical protein
MAQTSQIAPAVIFYCPWSETEDWEFDGTIDGLDLPWSEERLGPIERGEADPNEEELRQWRQAMCRKLATMGEAWIVWIVPVTVGKKIEGYAVFLLHSGGAPEDAPILEGVFDNLDEAKAALTEEGVIAGDSKAQRYSKKGEPD